MPTSTKVASDGLDRMSHFIKFSEAYPIKLPDNVTAQINGIELSRDEIFAIRQGLLYLLSSPTTNSGLSTILLMGESVLKKLNDSSVTEDVSPESENEPYTFDDWDTDDPICAADPFPVDTTPEIELLSDLENVQQPEDPEGEDRARSMYNSTLIIENGIYMVQDLEETNEPDHFRESLENILALENNGNLNFGDDNEKY